MQKRMQRLCTHDLALGAGSIVMCFSQSPAVLLRHVYIKDRVMPPIEISNLLQRLRSFVFKVVVRLNIFDGHVVDIRARCHFRRLVPAMQHTTCARHSMQGFDIRGRSKTLCIYPHTECDQKRDTGSSAAAKVAFACYSMLRKLHSIGNTLLQYECAVLGHQPLSTRAQSPSPSHAPRRHAPSSIRIENLRERPRIRKKTTKKPTNMFFYYENNKPTNMKIKQNP